MNFKSLAEYIGINKYRELGDNEDVFYDLFSSTFKYDQRIVLSEYRVPKGFDMRLDLVFQEMYNLEPNEVGNYLEDMDVIYFINNIDNPLNIKEGLVLKYPPDLGNLREFRVLNVDDDINNKDRVKEKLAYPNKSTRKDKSRENFVKNGYSLPPVILETPRPPVSIKDGKFNIGGL